MKNFQNREVRVFISSTFLGMNNDRKAVLGAEHPNTVTIRDNLEDCRAKIPWLDKFGCFKTHKSTSFSKRDTH